MKVFGLVSLLVGLLTWTSMFTSVEGEEFVGYVIDNYCWDRPNHRGIDGSQLDTAPEEHKLYCLLLNICIGDGFALLEEYDDNGVTKYDRKYKFDEAGDTMVKNFFQAQLDAEGGSQNALSDKQLKLTGEVSGGVLALESVELFDESVTDAPVLAPTGGAPVTAAPVPAPTAPQPDVFVGFVVDNYCWNLPGHVGFDGAPLETAPETHKLGCMLLPQCKPDGYVMLESYEDNGATKYRPLYQLDDTGDAIAIAYFEELVAQGGIENMERMLSVVGVLMDDTIQTQALRLALDGEQSFSGYVVDNVCWNFTDHVGFDGVNLEFSPQAHSLACLTKPECVEGGYFLLEEFTEDDETKFRPLYQLDDRGNELALEIFTAESETDRIQFDSRLHITGVLVDDTIQVNTLVVFLEDGETLDEVTRPPTRPPTPLAGVPPPGSSEILGSSGELGVGFWVVIALLVILYGIFMAVILKPLCVQSKPNAHDTHGTKK